jgi:hypothetical protein
MNINLPGMSGGAEGFLPFFTGQGANPFLTFGQPGGATTQELMAALATGQFEAPETGLFGTAARDVGLATRQSTISGLDMRNFLLSGRLPTLGSISPLLLRTLSPTVQQALLGLFTQGTEEGQGGTVSLQDIAQTISRMTPTGL